MAFKTISGTCEITTGAYTPTATAPVYQLEKGATLLSVDLESGGSPYTLSATESAYVKFYFASNNTETAKVLMAKTTGNISVELSQVLTAIAGQATAFVTVEDSDGNVLVSCEIPVPIKRTSGTAVTAYEEPAETIVEQIYAEFDATLTEAQGYVTQLASGVASPAGTYADLAALNAADPDHSKIYITLDNGNWCYYSTGSSAFVAGGVYQAAGGAFQTAIAPAYSAASTYALGAICTYLGKRYKCTTAITVAEAWTAGHWTEEPVQTVLDEHDSQLAEKATQVDLNSTNSRVVALDEGYSNLKSAVSEDIVGGAETAVNTITGTQVYYDSQYGLLSFRTKTGVNVNVYAVEAGKTYYVTGYGKSGENDPAAVLAVANVSSGTTAYFAVVDGAGSSYAYINQTAITPAQNGYIYVNINASDIKVGLKKQNTINNLLPDVTYLKQQTLAYMLQSYTIKNGYYVQNSASYTPNASYFSVYESCTPGEKFKISSRIKDAIVPYVQFYKQDETVLSWIPNSGTLPKDVTNYEYVVPDGAAYFSVTSYQIRPVVQKYTLAIDQTEHFPLYLHRRNALAEVMFKYAAEKDAVVVFNKVGPNNILQIAGFATVANDANYCSGNFDAARTTLRNAGSDWMSPYKVIAVNNADGDGAGPGVNGYYTGGFHGYNGVQTGAATGETTSYKFFVDGKEVTETSDAVYHAAKEVVILVTNAIQGNNTTKSDGTGRAILQEQIKYTVTPNRIDIVNTITALEDIVVSQYYGLQLYKFSNMNGFMYYGDTVEEHDFTAITTYTDDIDYLVGGLSTDTDRLVCQLDKKGIGRHQFIQSGGIMARSIIGSKAYNNLIDNPNNMPLDEGDSVFISGHYAFAKGYIPN